MSKIYQHYMEETNTVADLDEKQVEEVASESTAETTEQTTEDTQVDPYEEQLKKLEMQNRQKDGALKEERRKRKELETRLEERETEETEETPSKGLTLEEVDKLFEKRLAKEKFESRLESFSNNENERKVIRFHYENSINRTGDVATDLTMAAAIANQHIIQKAKAQEQEQFETEATLARVSRGGVGARSSGTGQDALSRATAALLKNLGAEDAIKHIT